MKYKTQQIKRRNYIFSDTLCILFELHFIILYVAKNHLLTNKVMFF